MASISIKEATLRTDTAFIIACFDAALPYLASIGCEGQWGTKPFSERKWFCDEISGFVEGDRDLGKGIAWIADVEIEVEGHSETKPAGAIVLTTTGHQAPQSVSPSVKEVYVKFLIADRRLGVASKGVGAHLLDFAKEVTRREQIKLLRVDCWSGGNGGLVNQGFVRDKFLQYPDKHHTSRDWIGWVFELWIQDSNSPDKRIATISNSIS